MNVFVSGLINIESTCPVKGFPVEYFPIDYPFNRISSGISGVGYNLIENLNTLGDEVVFVSMLGKDIFGNLIQNQLIAEGFDTSHVYPILDQTPQSIILYDPTGKREIYCDLKDYQDKQIESAKLEEAIEATDIVIACNSNFTRPICELARRKNKLIATDVHVFWDVNDGYNKDFLEAADIVFLSDESAIGWEENLIRQIYEKYHNRIIVMGCGSRGALLFEAEREEFTWMPAVSVRPVVSTSGAGDALFSSFIHFYGKGESAKESLRKATIIAGYKIGERISSRGFLTEEELEKYL